MSTQINITVGSGGLSERATQQQLAARQAQLEKERQQRVEALGTEQRNAKLAAEGKAPDGSLLNGPAFNQPDIKRRPAANRLGGLDILLAPSQNYNAYGILAKTKKLKNLNFVNSTFNSLDGPLLPWDNFVYAATGGPALNTPSLTVPVAPLPAGVQCQLDYVVTNNSFVQSIGYLSEDSITVQIADSRIPWQSSITAKNMPVFTAEIYLRAGDGKTIPQDSDAQAGCGFSFMGFESSLELYTTLLPETIGEFPQVVWVAAAPNIALNMPEFMGYPSAPSTGVWDTVTGEVWISDGSTYIYYGVPPATTTLRKVFYYRLAATDSNSTFILDDASVVLSEEQGKWRHLAYVRDETETSFYLDGVLVGSGTNTPILNSSAITGGVFGFNALLGGPTSVESALHGYRVTPKVLYTTNFAPPASITSFA